MKSIRDTKPPSESNDPNALLFQKLPVPVAVMKGDVFANVNQALLNMLRCGEERVIGCSLAQFVHPKDLDRVRECCGRWMAGDTRETTVEFTIERTDETNVEVEASVIDQTGKDDGEWVVALQDVTERRFREAELVTSEEFYRTLAETASVGIISQDLTGGITYLNRFLQELTGYTIDESIGSTLNRVIAPSDMERARETFEKATLGESTYGLEINLVTKSGVTCPVLVNTSPVREGDKVTAVVSVVQDLNRLKQAQAALARSEEQFRDMADAVPVGILATDPSGVILFANQETTAITGYESHELLGKIKVFPHPDDTRAVFYIIDKAIHGEGSRNHHCRFIRRDGSVVWVSLSIEPRLENGSYNGVYVAFADITHLKAAEEALRESEARFRSFIENTSDIITVIDAQGYVRYLSPAAERISGFSLDELNNTNVLDFVHPDDLEESLTALQQLLNSPGSTAQVEVRQRTKNGEWRLLEVVGSSILDDAGVPYVVLNSRDITARKQAEQALRESEERYRGLIESQQDLIVRVDPEGRFTFVNDAYCRMFGKSADELLNKPFIPLVHPDDIDTTLKEMEKLKVPPYRCTVEQRAQTVHGWKWIFWEDYSIRDENGQIVEIQAVGRDVTESKRVLEALKESEAKFRSYINQSIDGIFVIDGSGRFVEVNPAGCLMTGYSEEELLRMTVVDLVEQGSENERIAHEQLQTLIETGQNKGESELRRRDGVTLVVEINAVTLGSDRYMGIVRDVTERKKAEEAVLKSLDALEKAYALQSEFVRNMTHEVRTPLTGVIGYAQMLLEGITGNVSDEQRKVLKRIVEQAESLLAIVEEVLESATLAAGIRKLDLRTIRPEQIIQSSIQLCEAAAKDKQIQLECSISPKLPVLVSDAQKLTRILSNLITNAVKFTFTGTVTVSAERNKDGVDIVVVDTGIGIPEEKQESIFDAFVQLSYPGKHKPVGAGLGLSIVRELVDALGCSLVLSSMSDVGTAFTLHVPLRHKEMK